MSLPQWKVVVQSDFYRIENDETGVYEPEMEVVDEVNERSFLLYRFPLEKQKKVGPFLVPFKYQKETWPFPTKLYEPWFVSGLESIAASFGASKLDLVMALCSEDPIERAWAYQAIGGHYGWLNFDGYPTVMSSEGLDKRWDTK